jgi:hypothetical protein
MNDLFVLNFLALGPTELETVRSDKLRVIF